MENENNENSIKTSYPGVNLYRNKKGEIVDGTYTLRIHLTVEGQHIRKSFNVKAPSDKKANAILEKKKAEVLNDTKKQWGLTKENLNFVQLVKRWREVTEQSLDTEFGYTRNTYDGYNNTIDSILIPYFGIMPIRTITPSTMYGFMDYLKKVKEDGTRRSAGTINNNISVMKTLMRFAKERGLIAENPTTEIKLIKRSKKEASYFTEKQLMNLLLTMDNMVETQTEYINREIKFCTLSSSERKVRDNKLLLGLLEKQLLLYLCVMSGGRRGETLALRWNDVEYGEKTIRVVFRFNLNKSRGEASRRQDRLKNHDPSRDVYLSNDLKDLLERYIALQEQVISENGWSNPDNSVFITLRNGKNNKAGGLVNADTFTSWFKKWCRKYQSELGLTDEEVEEAHLHMIRHSFVSYCLNNGIPLKVVASFVGHHSEELTFGTYGHAYDMMKAQIAGKTAEIIQAKEVAKTEAKDSEE